jgi:hypothetical protein
MIRSLRELLGRVDRFSGRLGSLGDDLRSAIEDAERDSVASAIRARRVLDHIVRRIFERNVKETAGSRPMEQLLTRIVKDGHFPDELAGFAQAVKGLANRVAHDVGSSYPVEFLVPTLGQLMLIVEWYFDRAGSEAGLDLMVPRTHRAAEIGRAGVRDRISGFSRLCVYLSSASEDLREHQQSAEQVIGEAGWLAIRAIDDDPAAVLLVDALRRGIQGCDLVLMIVGHRRGLVPTPAQGGDGERSIIELVLEAARRWGIPVRALLAGEGWPEKARESEPEAVERVVRLREALAPFAAPIELGSIPDEAGPGVPRPGPAFGSMVRALLRDHRDRILDEAARRRVPSPSQGRSRSAGAEMFLPRLNSLLEGVILPRHEVARVYRDSAPPGWDPLPSERNHVVLLSECIQSLARAPRQRGDGLVPLVRFVHLIGELVASELANGLRDWIGETLNHMALDADDEARAKELHGAGGDEPAPEASYHLLVQVAPRFCEAGLYIVKAWLFGTEGPACLRPGEEKVAREDLPSCLDALLADLHRFDAATDRTWVELLLPRELLCADVDQWRVGLDFIDGIPIGVEHRLTVRSLERSSRSRAVQALQERWRAVRRRIEAPCRLTNAVHQLDGEGGMALWIERDDCGGTPLYASLKDAKGLVAVVLGCPPRPDPRDPSRDVLNTLFQAGVPIVLWARQPPAGGAEVVRETLAALLDVEPFGRLPDRVWDLRKQGAARMDLDDLHLGRHLSLLWDDPSRTSPDFEPKHRLQAPTPAG